MLFSTNYNELSIIIQFFYKKNLIYLKRVFEVEAALVEIVGECSRLFAGFFCNLIFLAVAKALLYDNEQSQHNFLSELSFLKAHRSLH